MLLDSGDFGDRLLSLVSAAMPLDGCCFYRVVDGQHAVDHRLSDLSPYWLEKYRNYFWRYDPLHPGRMTDTRISVCTFGWQDWASNAWEREYAAGFLAPQKTRFQAELYFRRDSVIVAGASLLRDSALGKFTERDVGLLEKLVIFSGFGPVDDVWRRERWLNRMGLTPKEREIASMLGSALSNKEIGRRLDIALPTVKTHVGRVLEKCGARSRSDFLRLFLDRDSAEAAAVGEFN
ncbi:MAG: helix-turn-helix transcriptional regulator [Rhizobiaceae bacterium]|nr:helix-turn-helix transcriptional regulator [Rhizobiaceae bacterium]